MAALFGHLGSRVSALVDDRLTPTQRRGALRHLERCDECADLLAQHRRQRRLASQLQAPHIPITLESRLLAMASQPGGPIAACAPRHPGRWLAVGTASAMGAAVLALGGLYLAGAQRHSPDSWGHTEAVVLGSTGIATADAASPAVTDAVWPHEVEFATTSASSEAVYRVDLRVDGADVVIFEGSGTLQVTEEEIDERLRVGDLEAYRVDKVWLAQAGGEVVAVCGPRQQSLDVIGSLAIPTETPMQRVLDGWDVLTGGRS